MEHSSTILVPHALLLGELGPGPAHTLLTAEWHRPVIGRVEHPHGSMAMELPIVIRLPRRGRTPVETF